jgi:hypothetical protein
VSSDRPASAFCTCTTCICRSEEVAAAMEAAQRSNSRTADPYGDDNLRDAATFMRERAYSVQ